MKFKIMVGSLVLGLGLCTQSFAFDLLDRMLGINGCGCNNGCAAKSCCEKPAGCAAPAACVQKPSCVAPAPTCAAPAPTDVRKDRNEGSKRKIEKKHNETDKN